MKSRKHKSAKIQSSDKNRATFRHSLFCVYQICANTGQARGLQEMTADYLFIRNQKNTVHHWTRWPTNVLMSTCMNAMLVDFLSFIPHRLHKCWDKPPNRHDNVEATRKQPMQMSSHCEMMRHKPSRILRLRRYEIHHFTSTDFTSIVSHFTSIVSHFTSIVSTLRVLFPWHFWTGKYSNPCLALHTSTVRKLNKHDKLHVDGWDNFW